MKITIYNCGPETMGSATDADAAYYRDWLTTEIRREFPGADVLVTDEQTTNSISTDATADDYAELDRLQYFVMGAWDRCPWDAAA